MALQPYTNYVDGQIINLPGPDGAFIGYMYNAEDRTFWSREASAMITLNHGHTHVGTDPVPDVTTATHGLMSSDDKVKLDTIVGTRLGVLGFQGAGFPDDGGWLQGDIILASGSESISLERVGNIVRFVVDVPTPLSCPCEECAEIYWVRDFADSGQNGYAVRGPQCGGLLPDVHTYGEFKVYLTPSNQIFTNPDSELPALMNTSPAFIFKRYDDGIAGGAGSNQAEMEMVLDRVSGSYVTKTGWSMTPGASGVAECVWHMGQDGGNNKITFKLLPNNEPGLIGALMYKGWTITQRPARITALHSTNSSTNRYLAEWWDGSTAPDRPSTIEVINAVNYQADGTIIPDVVSGSTLAAGRIVNVYSLETSSGVWNHFMYEIAQINPSTLWYTMGAIEFGNVFESRAEDGSISGAENVDDFKNLERTQWGLAGVYDDLVVDGRNLNQENIASIDTTLPGLVVGASGTDLSIARPVMIWNRDSARDGYLELQVARPDDVDSDPTIDFFYPPIDILLRAPVDSFENKYGYVKEVQAGAGLSGTVIVSGLQIHDIAPSGYIRVISSNFGNHNSIIKYDSKSAFFRAVANTDFWDTAFISEDITCGGTDVAACITAGDVVEVLHQEYTTPAVRLLFRHSETASGSGGSGTSGSIPIISMQAQVGTLGMGVAYENDDITGIEDNYVRGFEAGYAVSGVYTQNGTKALTTDSVVSVPSDFVVYNGQIVSGTELFNTIKILLRDDQVYIWWNDLAITPSPSLSAALPTPVSIATAYFPIVDEVLYGKFGLRLWPGAKLRRFISRTNFEQFSQFTLGVNSN